MTIDGPPRPPAPGVTPATLALTTPWAVVVVAYLDAAIDSPHTRRAYALHLPDAFGALGIQTVAELTGAQLAAHRARLTAGGLAPTSQAQTLAALRAFLAWSRALGAHRLPASRHRWGLPGSRHYSSALYTASTRTDVVDGDLSTMAPLGLLTHSRPRVALRHPTGH